MIRNKARVTTAGEAEAIALRALAFLAEDAARLASFMNVTGHTLPAIRENAGSRDFLSGILEYLLGDESLLLTFCGNAGLDPGILQLALHRLSSDR